MSCKAERIWVVTGIQPVFFFPFFLFSLQVYYGASLSAGTDHMTLKVSFFFTYKYIYEYIYKYIYEYILREVIPRVKSTL